MSTATKKNTDKIVPFNKKDKELLPLSLPSNGSKYGADLAVFQNTFFELQHEKPLKDDVMRLLIFFSPQVRLSEEDPTEETIYQIRAKEYAGLTKMGIKGAYSALERAVESLYDHSVIYNDERRGRVKTRLVTSVGYKEGVFSVSFSHFALHVMRVFNKQYPFTKLQIIYMARLSGHALKLYPFLVQNVFRKSFSVSIEDIKNMLSIDVNSYQEYKEFKKQVLKPHLDQITLNTDLSISFVAEKLCGKKASHVRFTITEKKEVKQVKQPENPSKEVPEIDHKEAFKLVCSIIVKDPELISRFRESGEATNEMIDRIRDDFKSGNGKRWADKLAEFGYQITQ